MAAKTERINLRMSEKEIKSLGRLQKKVDSDMTGVIRKALSVYETLLRETSKHKGSDVCVVRGGHIESVLILSDLN